MKRYGLLHGGGATRMEQIDNGPYIRHDDPAIKAAVEAIESQWKWYENMLIDHVRNGDDNLAGLVRRTHGKRMEQLRTALAGLKGEA